jgi:hypothetical protein
MNNQEFFTKTVLHLRKQGKSSVDPIARICKYRHEDSETGEILMCAIGCHIPEDKYDSSFEGKSIKRLLSPYTEVGFPKSLFDGVDRFLMISLQRAHDDILDGAIYYQELENRFASIANLHGLVVPE